MLATTHTAPKILGRANRTDVIVQMPLKEYRYFFMPLVKKKKSKIEKVEDDTNEIVFQGDFEDGMKFLFPWRK